ncbi:hypothetical protein Godav_026023, partial [Gossypium davidsonii]|nr:hypothetical protein [Gossypium davidsonii]
MRAPIQSPDPTVQLMIPMQPPFQVGANGPMYRLTTHEGSQEGPTGSSSFYQSPPPYGFQTLLPLVMQTPQHSIFYQGGSSSQLRQPDALPKEPESPPEEPQ